MVAMCVARGYANVGGLVLLEGWTVLGCSSDAFEAGRMYGQLPQPETQRIRELSEFIKSRFDQALWHQFWTSVQNFDGREFLNQTDLPIWQVYGAMGKKANAPKHLLVPDRENIGFVWIEGSGHYLPHECPDEIAEVCNRAIAKLDSNR